MMNEKIKEIKDKAWDYALHSDDRYSKPTTELFDEKFAELIIRACAEVGLDSVEDGDNVDVIMKRVHDNILKHFGVDK